MDLQKEKWLCAGVISCIGGALGWKGSLAVIWVGVMLLDYVSGTLAACKAGQWSSTAARQGLWHKCGMILAVTVSAVADLAMDMVCRNLSLELRWPGVLLPLVVAWYIVTELGSILENAVRLGARVPGWLCGILKLTEAAVDQAAEHSVK